MDLQTRTQAASETPDGESSEAPSKGRRRTRSGWTWGIGIAAVLGVELFLYGYRGHLTVCVGKTPDTDFSLIGRERTDANRWQFPRCEKRLNLGLRSGFEQRRHEAAATACRGATLLRHKGEHDDCARADGAWRHQVTTEQCWPWHRHFLRSLFWFMSP